MTETNRPAPPGRKAAMLTDGCTLAPDALADRLSMIRREIAPHASATRVLGNGVAWDFVATKVMRERLEGLARVERECCGGLDFSVWEDPTSGRLRFEILGADPKSGFFDGLLTETSMDTATRPIDPRTSGTWTRLLKRAGLASFASLMLCCVLPVALVSFAGIGVAAPLMKLDDPWIIAGGAIAFSALMTLYERRRARRVIRSTGAESLRCDC